jgi:DNA primase large subunit
MNLSHCYKRLIFTLLNYVKLEEVSGILNNLLPNKKFNIEYILYTFLHLPSYASILETRMERP